MGERAVGDWVISTHIGSGSFAIVWKAKHRLTGQEAAIKEIALDKLNAKLRQSLESEVSILKRINHDNIVKLLEVFEEKSRLYLIMEYCAGGDLAHYIRAHRRVPEAVAQHFMQQLAAGLREMWAHHLVHRDLKPQNLLLEGPGGTSRLKIADFGFARNLQPQGLAETLCGSPLYMAPEILHFHKYDAKADLWSVGAILFELVAGKPPFNGQNQFQLLRNIERGEARLPDAVAAQLSLPCRQLIHALLRRNPVERISFEEFFRHPFLTSPPPVPAPGASPFAAGGLPLGRSFSASSIPQQVLGFNQQPLRGAGLEGGAGPPSTAAPAAPAVVPPGELSNQLKPRRSLDLDGVAQRTQHAQQVLSGGGNGTKGDSPPGAAGSRGPAGGGLAAQLAALSQQTPPQQQPRREEQRPEQQQQQWSGGQQQPQQQQRQARSSWSIPKPPVAQQLVQGLLHVGSQGKQALFGGRAQPATPHGSAPSRILPFQAALGFGRTSGVPASLPTAMHFPQQLQAQAASRAQPHPQSGLLRGVPEPSVPPPPRAAAAAPAQYGGAARAGTAGAAGIKPSESSHSIDDDYVLVDTSLSSHSHQRSSPPPPASPASGSNSLGGSLHAQPGDEVFIATSPEEEAPAALGSPGAPLPEGVGGPRWQLLRRAAHAMELLAGPEPGPGLRPLRRQQWNPGHCLSLCLAALQVLELALDALPLPALLPAAEAAAAGQGAAAPAHPLDNTALEAGAFAPAAAAAAAAAPPAGGAGEQEAAAAAAALRGAAKVREDIVRLLGRAQAAAAALAQQEAAAEGGAAAGAGTLPDPWELCYDLSLELAKEAAVDELLGDQERSLQLYSKACCLLHFLCAEAPSLPLEPPLQLTQQDRLRLLRYAAATSARWVACKAQVDAERAAAGEATA